MLLHLKNKTPDNGCLESIFMLADNCPVLKESVSDDFLGVLIKDVELVKAEANLDLVADLGLGESTRMFSSISPKKKPESAYCIALCSHL